MSAEDLLRELKLDECLTALQQQVRSNPADAKARVFLFQLLCVLGQYERALTQLNVAGDMDAGTLAMVQTYREALSCEALRLEIFAGRRSPLVFGDPEQWVALILQALALDAEGNHAQASELRSQGFENAPTTSGELDGQRFEWIADADSRLGPILEAVVNGNYYWIPFSRIKEIRTEPPEDLRDLVWMPAYFTWANGGETVGLIPTRYPGSEASDDPQIRMARKTDWAEAGEDSFVGYGQRLLATDVDEYPLLNVRHITLDVDQESAEEEGGESGSAADAPDG
jgi:type VI secretion system protein ImpE